MGHLIDGRSLTSASHAVLPTAKGQPQGLQRYEGLAAFEVLEHTARQLPGRIAIRYGEIWWTYSQLQESVLRCAAMLQRRGVQPGDRVGLLLPNVPEYVIAANAIWRVGGTVVAINPMMVADEVTRLLHNTGCRLVVSLDLLSHLVASTSEEALHPSKPTETGAPIQTLLVSIREHLPALQQVGYLWKRYHSTGHWTLAETEHCHWFWEEIDRTSGESVPVKIDPVKDTAYILPTGGTTGSPKAVALSHQNLVANAWQQYRWVHSSFGIETMLAVLPFFHSYGMSATVMGGTMMGATLVLHHRFNTAQVIRLIEEERPTVFHAVPAMLVAMNERMRSKPTRMNSIRWVISGGAPLEADVAAEFAKHSGALVVEGYGLSEASPVTHVGDLFGEPNYGTIGLPLPETECRLVDGDNREVAPGEVGELTLKGPQVMLGYWNDPVATSEAVRDGWLHTGDLAVLQDDGCYRIVGRKKDLIITSGFNVYPSEVETALREFTGVLDAAVVGVHDVQRGEVVKAFIVMKPGAAWNEAALRVHSERVLSKYKRPRSYERCTDLPRNFLGKVIRRELREPTPIAQEKKS